MRRNYAFSEAVRLNFVLMRRNWMTWLFIVLLMVCVAGGCLWVQHTNSDISTPAPMDDPLASAVVGGSLALFFAYFFAVFAGGLISTSIALERTSKVEETIFVRLSAAKLAASKYVALTCLLFVFLLILVGELAVFGMSRVVDLRILVRAIGLNQLGGTGYALVLVTTICACSLYAVLYGIAGTFVQDAAEIPMAQLPVTVLLLPAFVASFLAVQNPSGELAHALIFIPFTGPFVLVSQVLSGSGDQLAWIWSMVAFVLFLAAFVAILYWRLRSLSHGHRWALRQSTLRKDIHNEL